MNKKNNSNWGIIMVRNISLMFIISLLVVDKIPNIIEQARPWLAWSLVALNCSLLYQIFKELLKEEEKC